MYTLGFLTLAFLVAAVWTYVSDNRKHLQIWKSAMALCNMSEVKTSGTWAFWWRRLTARSGSIEVRIKPNNKRRVLVVVKGAEGFSIVKLRTKHFNLWAREIELGDEAFEDKFLIEGPVAPVCALLDGTVRDQLQRATPDTDTLSIGDGKLRVEVREDELSRILPVVVQVSRQLAQPLDVEGQLVKNARQDPLPKVRITNLRVLAGEHPGDPGTLAALRAACSDESHEVRVWAATKLGEEGRDILLNIAESSDDDASCARAVSELSRKLPFERVRDILSRSLQNGLLQTARTCLETLGRHGAAAVGVLAKVMAEQTGELAVAAAQALGATREAAAEPPLLQALQSEDKDLREAVAASLGRVGTAASVQPLQEAAERTWLALGLRQAARQAVGEIQSRIEGASPGQLTLAEAEAGQLSLATEAGQLSLAQAEAGQLSLEPFETGPPEEPEQPSPRAREGPVGRRV